MHFSIPTALPRKKEQLKIIPSSFYSIQELKISYPYLPPKELIIFRTHSNKYQLIATELTFRKPQCVNDFFTVLL